MPLTGRPVGMLRLDGRDTGCRVAVADTWWSRAVGLLGTRGLDDPVGLWIAPCAAIHMAGMRYAIDAVFVARDGTVRKVARGVAPWRAAACPRAHATLELRAGLADALHLAVGRRVAIDLTLAGAGAPAGARSPAPELPASRSR